MVRMQHLLPFEVSVDLSEEEWEALQVEEGGISGLKDYADSIFSFVDIVDRERPEDPADDDPSTWPIKERYFRVTRHRKGEVPAFETPVRMTSNKLSSLWIKADGYSDRSDLQDSFFDCKFVELNEEGFIYEVTRHRID